MGFFQEWNKNIYDPTYVAMFLSKSKESREVFSQGSEEDVRFACDVLRKIPMDIFLYALQTLPGTRHPKSDEIPQNGTLEKAVCEVPQALAFAPKGLICEELGLRLGAVKGGDAPRKSGEGNGKLAASLDLVIKMKLPTNAKRRSKNGYVISPLGRYLLQFQQLEEKSDIISRLLIRERFAQELLVNAMRGYAKYEDVVSEIESSKTRERRRQNVRRIMLLIAAQSEHGPDYLEKIDWKVGE